jgi:ribonuclease-3
VVASRPILAAVARRLSLGEYLLLGKGEENGGRDRPSILAAALEAVLGVVFLHYGYDRARKLAERLLAEDIAHFAAERSPDYKSLLQELGQRRFGVLPTYTLLESAGPEHEKVFTISVNLSGAKAVGRGRAKREAEQAAAKRLYLSLAELVDGEDRA